MADKTVTIGDTDVEIRETADGFEAVEAEDDPLAEFADELRDKESVGKVIDRSYEVKFSYGTDSMGTGSTVYVPDELRIDKMERDSAFSGDGNAVYVVVKPVDE